MAVASRTESCTVRWNRELRGLSPISCTPIRATQKRRPSPFVSMPCRLHLNRIFYNATQWDRELSASSEICAVKMVCISHLRAAVCLGRPSVLIFPTIRSIERFQLPRSMNLYWQDGIPSSCECPIASQTTYTNLRLTGSSNPTSSYFHAFKVTISASPSKLQPSFTQSVCVNQIVQQPDSYRQCHWWPIGPSSTVVVIALQNFLLVAGLIALASSFPRPWTKYLVGAIGFTATSFIAGHFAWPLFPETKWISSFADCKSNLHQDLDGDIVATCLILSWRQWLLVVSWQACTSGNGVLASIIPHSDWLTTE